MSVLVDLQTMKGYLRLESDDVEEDALIEDLIEAAEEYVMKGTGFTFEKEQPQRAKLIVKMLVSHWFDNRAIVTSSHVAVNKLKFSVDALIEQLKYTHVEEEVDSL